MHPSTLSEMYYFVTTATVDYLFFSYRALQLSFPLRSLSRSSRFIPPRTLRGLQRLGADSSRREDSVSLRNDRRFRERNEKAEKPYTLQTPMVFRRTSGYRKIIPVSSARILQRRITAFLREIVAALRLLARNYARRLYLQLQFRGTHRHF